MRKKVALWTVILLVNAIIGVISVRTYQNLEARITSIGNFQSSSHARNFMNYQEFKQLQSSHKKTSTELLRILGVDGRYDFNNNLVRDRDLDKIFDYKVYVRTSVTLEVPEKLIKLDPDSVKSVVRVSEAPAVVIGRYVLMASHVVDAAILSRQKVMINAPFGVLEQIFEFKVMKYSTKILLADGSEHSLKELYRNIEKDFSLFEMQESISAPNFPFEIGKSGELQIGHFIYMNGRPKIHSEVARPGYVTSLVSAVFDGVAGTEKNNNEFGLSQSTDSGDSGFPVMAFRDGRPELIGIYLGWTYKTVDDNSPNTRSRALKINVAIEEIKEKLKLDLRELQHQILSR